MPRKILIFDSGTIIGFVITGLEELLPRLKKQGNVKFIMTSAVKFETIKRPIQSKMHELGALKIKAMLEEGVFESPQFLGISDEEIEAETSNVLNKANKLFSSDNHPIHLIEKGEASCLALYNILKRKNMQDKIAIAVDERTTRMLGEKPENLRKLMEQKLHTKIELIGNYNEFTKYIFLRSAELVYISYKRNLIELRDNQLLDALLYAVKFAGCSISREEIEEMKRL